MKLNINKLIIFVSIVAAIFLSGCKEQTLADMIDEAGLTPENVTEWSLDISYISETRGTGDRIYTNISGSSNEFIELLNSIYVSSNEERPNYIFSAEAMCEYRIDMYHLDKENAVLTLYYLDGGGNNMLSRVTKSIDEKDSQTYVDYDFYKPDDELITLLQEQRDNAYEPKDELAISFVSRQEMISSITSEELEYYVPETELEDESQNTDIEFEFYEDELPADDATNAQIYSNRALASLDSEKYLIVARETDDTGVIRDLSITEVRYNDYYTLVFINRPDYELLESMNVTPNNAILVSTADVPLDRWIVFLDDDDDIVDVINPDLEMQ